MRRNGGASRVAQVVLQRLGKGFDAGLGNIIGRVAGRCGDALLGAGVDDQATFSMSQHPRPEYPTAVDDAPEVDGQHPFPVFQRPEQRTARLDTGIVHYHMHGAETGCRIIRQHLDIGEERHVGGDGGNGI